MNKMPREIKSKLRKINRLNKELSELSNEVAYMFENYNIEFESFDEYTEDGASLIRILNDIPEDINESIKSVEKAFVKIINSK